MIPSMVTVIFETHSTSVDNELGLASGHADTPLSALGQEQAEDLGRRRQDQPLRAVFCSDLQRSYRTGELAFGGTHVPIIRDPRLRECDYGEWTQRPAAWIAEVRGDHIDTPFPGGESYHQAAERVRSFLEQLRGAYQSDAVLIIGHRATQYALQHWLEGVPLEQAVTAPWTWQPGWTYVLK